MIEDARLILDGIDLDPASCEYANDRWVLADTYYDRKKDGLNQRWFGNVFLNPPGTCGGLVCGWKSGCGCKLAHHFWVKAVNKWHSHQINPATGLESLFWVGFSLEQLGSFQSGSNWSYENFPHPLQFPHCHLRKRLHFIDAFGDPDPHPTHGNYVALLPRDAEQIDDFRTIMSRWGHVTVPAEPPAVLELSTPAECQALALDA